jgi:hypothetical protein
MQLPDFPRKLGSVQVLIRFSLRLLVLVVFAMFGSIGFGRSLAALLWMSTILSAVVAVYGGNLRSTPCSIIGMKP